MQTRQSARPPDRREPGCDADVDRGDDGCHRCRPSRATRSGSSTTITPRNLAQPLRGDGHDQQHRDSERRRSALPPGHGLGHRADPVQRMGHDRQHGASRQFLFDSDGLRERRPARRHRHPRSPTSSAAPATPGCASSPISVAAASTRDVTNPADHGALFDFGFGGLAPGEARVFQIYYGAAPSRASALSAIAAQGIGVYSLGEPNCGAPAAQTDLCAGIASFGGVTSACRTRSCSGS